MQLDRLDLRILDELQRDSALPVTELAERVDSSKSVCWRRMQRLQQEGVIKERVAIVDREAVGLKVMIFAHVKMNRHGRSVLPHFVDEIKTFPQVVECHTLMGDVDFLLKIVVKDIEEYEHFFWQQLSQMEGVQEVSSSIVMTEVASTTALPLREELISSRV